LSDYMRDALRFSLQREFEAMAFYEAALGRVRDGEARAALEFLSREERRHLAELSERFARERLGEEETRRFLDALRSLSEIKGREKLEAILSRGEADAKAILRAALEEEKRSEDLYRLNARTMPDVETRALYLGLMKEEKEHVKTLKAVLRLVEKGVVDPRDLRVRGSRTGRGTMKRDDSTPPSSRRSRARRSRAKRGPTLKKRGPTLKGRRTAKAKGRPVRP